MGLDTKLTCLFKCHRLPMQFIETFR